jgi:membrane fusion protein
MAVVVVFLVVGTYARRETVYGSVVSSAGAAELRSHRAGTLVAIHAEEGTRVSAGQVLFSLSTNAAVHGGQAIGEALQGAAREQSSARLADLSAQRERNRAARDEALHKRGTLAQRASMLEQELDLQRERLNLAERTLRDVEPLFSKHHLPLLQFRQYQANALEARQRLLAYQRDLASVDNERAELNAQLQQLEAEADSLKARSESEYAALRERLAHVEEAHKLQIASPIDGVLAASGLRVGSAVGHEQVLGVVVPTGAPLLAEVWVESRAIGFLRTGQRVRLMYDAFPYQRFGFGQGEVVAISSAPLPAPEAELGASGSALRYRALVRILQPEVQAYGQRWPILPGMRLTADVVLETRSFLDWLLDPIRAAAVRR